MHVALPSALNVHMLAQGGLLKTDWLRRDGWERLGEIGCEPISLPSAGSQIDTGTAEPAMPVHGHNCSLQQCHMCVSGLDCFPAGACEALCRCAVNAAAWLMHAHGCSEHPGG